MNTKKLLAFITAMLFILSLAACSSTTTDEATDDTSTEDATTTDTATDDTSSTQQVGQITEIDGAQVTLLLGELSTGMGAGGDMPEGEAPDDLPSDAAGSSDTASEDTTESADTSEDTSETADTTTDSTAADATTDATDTTTDSTAADSADSSTDSTEPPELPDGETASTDGEAPEMPDGETPSGDGEAPEMPDGEAPSGDGGAAPGGSTFTAGEESVTVDLTDITVTLTEDGQETEGTYEDLEVGDILTLTYDESGNLTAAAVVTVGGGAGGSGGGESFGGSGEVTQGTAANTIEEDSTVTDTTYTSEGDDENALRITDATVTLDGVTVEKTGGATSNTEDGDFYGMNAALLATDGAQVTITNATVNSSAQNGNGVFSYGEGTTVTISDSTITTTADNSGGIQTTGGGTTIASNLTVSTAGNSSAAIRSDRGGGTVTVDGGTYTSSGYNSPAVYSTAEITVSNATLTAENSEALVIEGENSITLSDCIVSGNMSDTEGTSSDENVHNVMIYQSMSGDAEVGTSTFSMTGGSLTAENGDMFYITNTHCVLTLSGVEIVNNDSEAALMRIVGNSASHGWGTAGSNGAQVEFTADGQTLEGDIIVDTISTLTMTLTNGSTFTGTVQIVENEEGGTAVDDNAVITIESGCTWNLTGDCTVTSLDNQGTINFNGYTITLADGTVLSE